MCEPTHDFIIHTGLHCVRVFRHLWCVFVCVSGFICDCGIVHCGELCNATSMACGAQTRTAVWKPQSARNDLMAHTKIVLRSCTRHLTISVWSETLSGLILIKPLALLITFRNTVSDASIAYVKHVVPFRVYTAKIAQVVYHSELTHGRLFFLQAEYGVLKEEVGAMKSLASRLSDVCPERMNAVGTEIQTCLYSWEELGKSVAENKKRLRQFGHLRHFFRNYLAMM